MDNAQNIDLERVRSHSKVIERKRSATERESGETGDKERNDSPHKKHCLREIDHNASQADRRSSMGGVKLRLQNLAAMYQTNETVNENSEDYNLDNTIKTDQEPVLREKTDEVMAEVDSSRIRSHRASRLSALAQNINSWEDDLKPTSTRTSTGTSVSSTSNTKTTTITSKTSTTINTATKPAINNIDVKSSITSNTKSEMIDTDSVNKSSLQHDLRNRRKSSDDILERKTPNYFMNQKQDLSSAVFDIAAGWESGKSSKGIGAESKLPSVSERMAGWQKKVDESETTKSSNSSRRSLLSQEELRGSTGRAKSAGVRARMSMWEQKGGEQGEGVGSSTFDEFRKRTNRGSEARDSGISGILEESEDHMISETFRSNGLYRHNWLNPFNPSVALSSTKFNILEKQKVGTEAPKAASRKSILGLVHKNPKSDSTEFNSSEKSPEIQESGRDETSNRVVESVIVEEVDGTVEAESLIKFDKSPVKCDKSPAKCDKSPVKCDKFPVKCDKSPVKCDNSPVKCEKKEEESENKCVDMEEMADRYVEGCDSTPTRGVEPGFEESSEKRLSQVSGSNTDLVSVTSSMIDAEIQSLSSQDNDNDDDNDDDDDDDADADGVFELLDEAIGDSLSCTSQHSGNSDKHQMENSRTTFQSNTPPSDGTSISSSSLLSDAQSSRTNSAENCSKVSASKLNEGNDADIIRHHKVNDGLSGDKKKQNARSASDGFLLEDYSRSESCGDPRATYISDSRLGSTSDDEDVSGSKSLEDLSHNRNKLYFDPRASVRSSIRYNPFHKPSCDNRELKNKPSSEQVKILNELVSQEHNVIVQTSNALNQCCHVNSAFASSPESVECHRVLLVAEKKQETFQKEILRLNNKDKVNTEVKVCNALGNLTISDIVLPMKTEFLTKLQHGEDVARHYFVTMLRCGAMTYFTPMLTSADAVKRGLLEHSGIFQFFDLPADFKLEIQIFSMAILKEPQIPKKRKGLTPRKLLKPSKAPGRLLDKMDSFSGIRTTSFSLLSSALIDIDMIRRNSFQLNKAKEISLLDGKIQAKIECNLSVGLEERGFLTLFEDVNGFGAWHRRWCLLKKDTLYLWKYPDEERTKDPVSVVDMKFCVTRTVEPIQRDFCARPNTVEMITVRRQGKSDQPSLVTSCSNNITTTKHWLSADTKEECQLWCNRFNETLQNLRAWQPDSMPVPK